ncbi:MAG: hypothetical protein ACKPEA_09275, partial [Planctomycetota bacterium]
ATKTNAFTYTASFTGGSGGMPQGGSACGTGDGPSDTSAPGQGASAVTMERCIEFILASTAPLADCAGTACDSMPPAELDPVLDGPDGPDLDGNGVPDLCQLRCGDLDMSGGVDSGDLAIILTLLGERAVLNIGDLDTDGLVTSTDVAALLRRIDRSDASASSGSGSR